MRRFVRAPDLLICWRGGKLWVEDLARKRVTRAGLDLVVILDRFGRPRTAESAVRVLSSYEPESIRRAIAALVEVRFLLPEAEAKRRSSRLAAWRWNLASAFYRAATRDEQYVVDPEAMDRFLRARVSSRPRPARFKAYPNAPRIQLPRESFPVDAPGLDATLLSRRTTREFARSEVSAPDFAAVLRGTFGRIGELDAGRLGTMSLKTSPSAGALHPIECYVIVSRVAGIEPGLYHYEVAADELRRLRRGDMRAGAVRAASGQRWIRGAAFVCILTAVYRRTLWKYSTESAFQTLWLDAGHLGQTFCLLATSRGLGSFVTAALQDTFIEELLGIDGIAELPVYLCGAGLPRGTRSEPERKRENDRPTL